MAINTQQIINTFHYKNNLNSGVTEKLDAFLIKHHESDVEKGLLNLQNHDQIIREEGHQMLMKLGWQFLQYNEGSTIVVETPELPGWLFKCSSQWQKNIRRCEGARQLKNVVVEHTLNHIRIPTKLLLPIANQYIVLSEKFSLLSNNKTIYYLGQSSTNLKETIAHQICCLIVHTGFSDTHFDNICMVNTNDINNKIIAIIDTDSVGGELSAKLGLNNIIDTTKSKKKLQEFNRVARETLKNLEEDRENIPIKEPSVLHISCEDV